MYKYLVLICMGIIMHVPGLAQNNSDNDQIRVIAIFAHPDDADSKMGGTAALFAKMGHAVKFVSLTNGDAGHYDQGGGILAKRRRVEAKEAGRRLGIDEYKVLDNHDGELLPELHVRMQVIREIRDWNADIVLGLRPNDYHPDHRNAGKLVQDASYMVIVPNVAPDTPPLETNPLFLYMEDGFQKPNPFSHDIVVGIDEVADIKLNGLDAHESQMYEWLPWTIGRLDEVPEDSTARRRWLKKWRMSGELPAIQRKGLEKWYGKQKAAQFNYTESFEIAEYGMRPTAEQIKALFPMLGQ